MIEIRRFAVDRERRQKCRSYCFWGWYLHKDTFDVGFQQSQSGLLEIFLTI
jgi:hypothetical protein